MQYESIMEKIRNALPAERILTHELMSGHTSFHVGGPADLFLTAETGEELIRVLGILREEEIPYFLLGLGTNILVGDRGYRGAVVTLKGELQEVKDGADPDTLRAGAGCPLSRLAAAALDRSLEGLEFAAGIPGSVGGAVTMNAGAYGGEMKQVVRRAEVLDRDGRLLTFSGEELNFRYRGSRIKDMSAGASQAVVLSAEFSLTPGDRENIAAKIRELAEKRKEKQPLEYPSAGSTFKRPEGYFAGKLIEEAGLRGFSVGGAQVSEKHCGFVINRGGATAEDVRRLILEVQRRVLENSGVQLEPEVILLGEF